MARIYPRPPRGEAPPEYGTDANIVKLQRIDLSRPRASERVEIGGSVLWAVTASSVAATCNIALNDERNGAFPVSVGLFIRGVRFSRIFVTNAVQAGQDITLLYASEDVDNISIENPASQFTEVTLAPATIAALNPVALAAASIAALNPVGLDPATIGALNPVALAAASIAALNPVTSRPQNLANGWASAGVILNPAANTIFADTGPLAAGTYDFRAWLGCGIDPVWRETMFEHRNAADAATLRIFQENWTYSISDHLYFAAEGYSIAANERLRLKMGAGAGATNWCGGITWVRRE